MLFNIILKSVQLFDIFLEAFDRARPACSGVTHFSRVYHAASGSLTFSVVVSICGVITKCIMFWIDQGRRIRTAWLRCNGPSTSNIMLLYLVIVKLQVALVS